MTSAGRFISADSVVPSNNQNTEDSKRIQLLLIVDYHEPNLLAQLGRMNRDETRKGLEPDGEQSGGKDQQTPKTTNTDPLESDKQDDTYYTNTANQTLENFNELSDIGKTPSRKPQDDKAQRSKGLVQVDMMSSRMNSMNLDRFAYTSNCPTKYTDPSGHCDRAKLIAGGVIAGLGLIPLAEGFFLFSFAEVEVVVSPASGPLAPVFLVTGLHEIIVGGMMMGVGGSFVIIGGKAIIDSGCIPGLEDSTTTTSP